MGGIFLEVCFCPSLAQGNTHLSFLLCFINSFIFFYTIFIISLAESKYV